MYERDMDCRGRIIWVDVLLRNSSSTLKNFLFSNNTTGIDGKMLAMLTDCRVLCRNFAATVIDKVQLREVWLFIGPIRPAAGTRSEAWPVSRMSEQRPL